MTQLLSYLYMSNHLRISQKQSQQQCHAQDKCRKPLSTAAAALIHHQACRAAHLQGLVRPVAVALTLLPALHLALTLNTALVTPRLQTDYRAPALVQILLLVALSPWPLVLRERSRTGHVGLKSRVVVVVS
jgi:hypothetical protein